MYWFNYVILVVMLFDLIMMFFKFKDDLVFIILFINFIILGVYYGV